MAKVTITIPQVEYEVDDALIDGLRYMGTLNELDLSRVPEQFHEPFQRLFQYAKERMKKGGRDRHLSGLVGQIFPDEPNASVWASDTDARHTAASFGYFSEICAGEGYALEDTKRGLSSIIVHDCAYPETGRVAQFNSDARIEHMQAAEKIFAEFANMINQDYPEFYSLEDIKEICALVRQHDNPDVKQGEGFLDFNYDPPKRELVWAHREADRLWMPDKAGYALDLIRRLVIVNPWYDNEKYLEHVIKIHTEEAERYADNDNCFEYEGKKTIYRTQTGFKFFTEEINKRAEEYGVDLD